MDKLEKQAQYKEAIEDNDRSWREVMYLLARCPERENSKYIMWSIQLCQVKNRLKENYAKIL